MTWLTFAVAAIVAAFGLTLIWLGGWFFGLALVVKVVLTVLLVSLIGIVLTTLYIVRLRAAARLERGLIAQGKKQVEAAGPAHRKDVLALQERAQQAIAALKATRLGGGGRSALYALPWYVIVGPPGVGKTTAIRHSGLDFPLEKAGVASRFRGIGGTKNCDWWFTSEAILLDTAGRYATEGDDQTEWFAFLDLLRKNRPRKPINGLLVAMSVADILRASEDERALIASRLRARMDEITTRLKTLVPVYVLFTKMDLVAGFSEFWGALRPSERGQAWGMAFPLGGAGEPERLFDGEFELLEQTLRARLVRRFSEEGHPRARRALWTFPVEFARLRESLDAFVGELFKKNAYQEVPLLRGVYFTSGTQEAAPSSQVIASMGHALGLKMPSHATGKVEPKSFFLIDVFRRIVFPDQGLAGRTEGERRRQLLMRIAVASFSLLVSASLVLPACFTWLRNRQLVSTTSSVSADVEALNWSDAAGLEANAARLDVALGNLRELAEWRDDGAPVQLRWGMYTGNALYGALRDVYAAAVSRAVLARAKTALEEQLRMLDSSPVRSRDSFNRDFDTLKLYLMLGDAQHVDPAWAAPRLVRIWSETARGVGKGVEELLLPHVAFVLGLEGRREIPAWTIDTVLADRSRSILAQVPQVDRLYESLVRDANTEIAPIRRETVFYGSVAPFVQSRRDARIAGAYTKQGWLRVRALLGEQRSKLVAEQWVLGDTADGSAGYAIGKLRDLYFERYRSAWRDFIADLQVQDPGNAEVALEEMNALSEPEWPYLRLIRILSENVVLEMDDDKGMVESAVDTAKQALDGGGLARKRIPSPVELAFRPILKFGLPPEAVKEGDSPPATGLSQYEALLAKIVGALTDLHDAESGADPRKMSEVFQDVFRSTSALLSEQDGFTRPLLSPLLMSPITLAWSNVVHDAGAAAGASWETSVWEKWHDKLEGRYPFATSTTDASLDDFLDFFARGDGALWSFYDESLKATLDRSGRSFIPSRRFRSSIGYTPDFLEVCLKRGDQITSVIFPPKGDHAAVVFDVNLHSVSSSIGELTFEVDGVEHTYRNEPEQWLTITWPGKSPRGARIEVRGTGGLSETIQRPGDFGLFRLLEDADVQPGRAGGTAGGVPTLVATWKLKGARDAASVSLDLRPARAENPLLPGYFKDYSCPRLITAK